MSPVHMFMVAVAGLVATGQCFAQQPVFDAASVKMFDPATRAVGSKTGGPGTSDPARYRNARATMIDLLTTAFDVKIDQVAGPEWIRDFAGPTRYDVVATMPADTTKEQFHAMLQSLLAERFHLAVHHETRNFPGYNLVVAKGGPKMKAVTPAQKPGDDAHTSPKRFSGMGKDGFPNLPPGPRVAGVSSAGKEREKYQEKSIGDLAAALGSLMRLANGNEPGTPEPRVIDKTGLPGVYDFTIEFACAGCLGLGGAAMGTMPLVVQRGQLNGPGFPPIRDPAGLPPDIFKALEKQLGLRLEKTADVPVDVIVVDRVDKIPTAN